MEKGNIINPCVNAANEITIPMRLHFKVFNTNEYFKIHRNIKCLDEYTTNGYYKWLYTDEILKTAYQMPPINNGEFWVLGKLKVTKGEMLITVNSVERAILALDFFTKKFKRKVLQFESIDIHNKMLEIKDDNHLIYKNIENYFENKPIAVSKASIMAKKIFDNNLDISVRQLLMSSLVELAKTEVPMEYENFAPPFYEDGIECVKSALNLRKVLAFEHLQGNTSMTFFGLIKRAFQNQQNDL